MVAFAIGFAVVFAIARVSNAFWEWRRAERDYRRFKAGEE